MNEITLSKTLSQIDLKIKRFSICFFKIKNFTRMFVVLVLQNGQ